MRSSVVLVSYITSKLQTLLVPNGLEGIALTMHRLIQVDRPSRRGQRH